MQTSFESVALKRVFDPVHGFIELTVPERVALSLKPLFRLRFIKQCGPAFFVYPGATHTRFEHSIGVLQVASNLFDSVFSANRSLFTSTEHYTYCRHLIRMAGLLHDVGHLPFSHTAENEILGFKGHEEKGKQIILSDLLEPAFLALCKENAYANQLGVEQIKQDVAGVCFLTTKDPILSLLAELVAGDFFGADRIDYLLRDSKNIGLPYGTFDHSMLLSKIVIDEKANRLVLLPSGIEAMEGLLMARYYLFQRVCNHPKVRILSMHLGQLMHQQFAWLKDCDLEDYIKITDFSILQEIANREQTCIHTYAIHHPMQLRFTALKIIPRLGSTKDQVKQELQLLANRFDMTNELFIEYAIREEKPLDPSKLFVKQAKRLQSIMDASNLLYSAPNLVTSMNKWIFVRPEHKEMLLQADYDTFCLEEIA